MGWTRSWAKRSVIGNVMPTRTARRKVLNLIRTSLEQAREQNPDRAYFEKYCRPLSEIALQSSAGRSSVNQQRTILGESIPRVAFRVSTTSWDSPTMAG